MYVDLFHPFIPAATHGDLISLTFYIEMTRFV